MPKSKEVDGWFARYDNPMKEVVLRIREIMLAADKRLGECIKWQAPTFTFNGNLASFFPKSKQHASLMFHVGARIPGHHPRLEGYGGTSRVMKIGSVVEANAAKRDLQNVVRAWCAWREETIDASGSTAKAKAGSSVRAPTKRKKPARKTKDG
jgi:uncharacterized protein YdhG (YjbR/CyaY superfamily)